jgi:predicted TIM-barrel fold metal-dependent hydrolase
MSPLSRSILDAHHRLWDLQALEYPWLMARKALESGASRLDTWRHA